MNLIAKKQRSLPVQIRTFKLQTMLGLMFVFVALSLFSGCGTSQYVEESKKGLSSMKAGKNPAAAPAEEKKEEKK